MSDVEGQAAALKSEDALKAYYAERGVELPSNIANPPRPSSNLDLLLEMDEPEELAIALHKATKDKGERWAVVAWHANEMVEAYKRANEPKK